MSLSRNDFLAIFWINWMKLKEQREMNFGQSIQLRIQENICQDLSCFSCLHIFILFLLFCFHALFHVEDNLKCWPDSTVTARYSKEIGKTTFLSPSWILHRWSSLKDHKQCDSFLQIVIWFFTRYLAGQQGDHHSRKQEKAHLLKTMVNLLKTMVNLLKTI